MHINVPEYNLSFIIPHKSGNTIIYSVLSDILDLNLIKFNTTFSREESEKNCFLFVRNPVDRFFSTYNWYMKMKKLNDLDEFENLTKDQLNTMKESLKIFEDLEIDTLSKFIEKYKLFINNSTDTHFLPQTSFFLKKSSDNGVRSNLNLNFRKEYDRHFENQNYRFFRIEDIIDIIDINKDLLMKNGLKNFGLCRKDNVSNINLKTFPFLKLFPQNMNYLFMVFHKYFHDFLSDIHHSNNSNYYYEEISKQEYIMVYEMFKKECIFFGYDDEPNFADKNFKNPII